MSFRDVEDPVAERGSEVYYETIRRWILMLGPRYRRALNRREGRPGDAWYVDWSDLHGNIDSSDSRPKKNAYITRSGKLSIKLTNG